MSHQSPGAHLQFYYRYSTANARPARVQSERRACPFPATGVFILSGTVRKFKVINKLYETEDSYIVEQSATDSDMLVEQDQVIVRGTDLKDNTVVKT